MRSWPQIQADSAALLAYRPRYAELRGLATPTLLLGGDPQGDPQDTYASWGHALDLLCCRDAEVHGPGAGRHAA